MLSVQDWHNRFKQQAHWTGEIRRQLFSHLPARGTVRVLEVGCGTGAVTEELGSESTASIYGLDINFSYLRLAAQQDPSTRFSGGNGYALPFPPATFDLCYCHFLLLWLKDPAACLMEMRRTTKNGGIVAAFAEPDYGGRIDYPDTLVELGQLQAKSLEKQGANPSLGRKLGRLFMDAGIKDVQIGLFGGNWGHLPSEEAQESEWAILQSDLEGMLPTARLQEFHNIDSVAWQKGERILFVPTFYAWGKVDHN